MVNLDYIEFYIQTLNSYLSLEMQKLGEENDWGWFLWKEILEEEDEQKCPECGSKRTRYDEEREVWVCLDCNYEWENN